MSKHLDLTLAVLLCTCAASRCSMSLIKSKGLRSVGPIDNDVMVFLVGDQEEFNSNSNF